MPKRKYTCPECGEEVETFIESINLPFSIEESLPPLRTSFIRPRMAVCLKCKNWILWDKAGRVIVLPILLKKK